MKLHGGLASTIRRKIKRRGRDWGRSVRVSALRPGEAHLGSLRSETLGMALQIARAEYEYVVVDLPHDFSEIALQALDAANIILMLASRDMASIRAVTAAMDTYQKLGYSSDKIKFVLSTPAPFPHSGLTKEKIEGALRIPALTTIPYVQDVLTDAINLGQPPVYEKPNELISSLFEDLAFRLSKLNIKKTNQ